MEEKSVEDGVREEQPSPGGGSSTPWRTHLKCNIKQLDLLQVLISIKQNIIVREGGQFYLSQEVQCRRHGPPRRSRMLRCSR